MIAKKNYFYPNSWQKLIIPLFYIMALFTPIAIAETEVINNDFKATDTFTLDGVPYSFGFDEDNVRLYVNSALMKLYLNNDTCVTKGYYKMCFSGMRYRNLVPPSTIAHLAVYKKDCVKYNASNLTLCKKWVYQRCNDASECLSGICLHGICSHEKIICGDGYCDLSEKNCDDDCNPWPESISSTEFGIYANRMWYNTNLLLRKGNKYMINASGRYSLDWSGTEYDTAGAGVLSNSSPCPDLPKGSLVVRLCDKCYLTNSIIIPHESCNLFLMINDNILLDNSGYITVKVNELSDISIETPAIITKTPAVTTTTTVTQNTEKQIRTETTKYKVPVHEQRKSSIDYKRFLKIVPITCIFFAMAILGIKLFLRQKKPKDLDSAIKKLQELREHIHDTEN